MNKNNINRKVKYFIILFLMIILPFNVNAKEGISLKVDKNELKSNDELNLIVDLEYDKDLYAFLANLSFDENVFEVINTNNFQEQDEWSNIVYNEENNKFALLNKSGMVKSHLFMLKLFVKNNPVPGKTEIVLNNPTASDGKKDIEFNSTSITLTVENTSGEKPSNAYSNNVEILGNTFSILAIKPFIITGIVLIVALIIGLILININILKDKLKINDELRKKLNIIFGILLALFSIATISLVFIINSRGDSNNDGVKDYDDANKINEYLIDITNEKNNTPNKDYDVNGDGQITITDSAKQEKDTTNKTNYKVELNRVNNNNVYVAKNENANLEFSATINPNTVKIKEVYIDGKAYKVEIDKNNYKVLMKMPSTSGVYDYTITKVILTNGREINVKNLKFTVEVLKTEPKIENFNYKDGKINFNINDKDKSLKSLHIKVVEGKVNLQDIKNSKLVLDKDINIESNNISLDALLEFGKDYTILISGNYDLDTNKLDSNSNYYKDQNLYFDTITNGEVKINFITDLNNLYVSQNEKVKLYFKAEINPKTLNQKIKKIVIDNKEYDVSIDKNGNYVLEMDANSKYGEVKSKITSVILGDDTKVLSEMSISYFTLKEKPSVIDFIYHEKEERITFAVDDKDKSLSKAKIIITKIGEKESVFEHELDLNLRDFAYSVKLEQGFKYDVKITGYYDLDNDKNNNKNDFDGSLFNYELTVYAVSISHFREKTYYANKDSEVELKFNAKIVPGDNIAYINKVTINNEPYAPTHYDDGSYGVIVKSPSTAGIKEYKIDKITLDDNKITEELIYNIDVLKDKPKVENFFIDESEETPIITFDIIDEDNALKSDPGEVIVKFENQEVKKYPIKKGNNKISLTDITSSLDNGRIYTVDIKVNYDLDSSKDNGLHEHTEYLIQNHEIKIYKINLKLSDNNYYFSKEEEKPINLTATINPETSLKITAFIMKDGTLVEANYKNGAYSINLIAAKNAGEEIYNIEKVLLGEDIKVKAPLEIKIDVLKDVPYVNRVNIGEDNKTLSYELVDVDNAFKNGTITINDKLNTNNLTKDLKSKETQFIDYDFKDEETYSIKVIGSYDLDSIEGDSNNVHDNMNMYEHSFLIGGEYNFTLTDVSITDAIKENEKPIVTFTSTNTKGLKIEKVTLNDKTYSVKENNNRYEVVINDADMSFKEHEVIFNSVTLGLKTFKNNVNFNARVLSYTVLKNSPSITNINLTNNSSDKTITAKYKVNDEDYAISKLKAVLVDSTDKIIATADIPLDEATIDGESVGITLSYDKNKDGKYRVKFLADYSLSNKYTYTNQNIGENEILTQSDEIFIEAISLKKSKYVNKNVKNYEISYDVYVGENIKTNNNKSYTRLSIVTVNGKNYIPNGESTDKPRIYKGKIGITTPSESGVLTLSASRVQLELNSYYDKQNDYYSVPKKDIEIEVLKDKPKIENLKVKEENYDEGSVTFEFDVKLDDSAKENDESFIKGSVILGEEEHEFKRNHNTIKFEHVNKDTDLELIFKASYDLDTDYFKEKDGIDENEFTNEEIYKTKYGLFITNKYENMIISDGVAISKNNNKYFEKNEKVKLNFKVSDDLDELSLKKVFIGNKEYNLTKKDDVYEFTIDGYNTFGEKEITISDITLSNGKKIKLNNPYTIKFEILKDIPKITNYKYEVKNDKINITSILVDSDASIDGVANVKITTEDGTILIDESYKNTFTINLEDKVSRYYVLITANYDRDLDVKNDSENYNKDTKLLDEIISLEINDVEFKDINDVNLYKVTSKDGKEEVTLINKVSKSEIDSNKESYFVEINMDNLKSIRVNIKAVKEENGHLIFVLDCMHSSIRNTNSSDLIIDFGEINDGSAINETHPKEAFEALLKKLKSNQEVTLTKNYDASMFNDDSRYYVEEYSSTLNGNGFTIKNLNKPLFNKIDHATIKNIKFEDVTMPSIANDGNGTGTIANNSNESTIENVMVHNYYKANNEGRVGIFFGNATNTTIKNSAADSFNIYAGWANLQQIGGFIGNATNTTIENSYANGKIPGGWNFRSGLIGIANGCTIKNNIIKVEINTGMGLENVFDIASGNNNTFTNNISLTTGFNHRPGGFKESKNNYYVDDENEVDINVSGFTKITKNAINKQFFIDNGFSEKIWSLDNVSYENIPIFQYEKKREYKDVTNSAFAENNINLYNNLMKLMPYYKLDKIIDIAKNVKDSNLINKELTHILPVDSKGNIVNYLTSDNVKKISKIKLVYKTNEHKEYKVLYDNTYDFVASYYVPELNISYNYSNYIINDDSQVVNNLTNYLKGLKYTENLDVLTPSIDSRIYKDFYNDTTKNELKEFVLKFLSNSNYTNTLDNDIINNYIEKSVKENNKIEKALYMYNYFRRFYDLDIDGMKLYDFMLFNMDGFDKSLTPDKIIELYFSDDNNFATSSTGTKYATVLGSYTKQDTIAKFIEYMVTEFGDGDLDEWTRKQFKGYLVELPVKGMEDEIQYTLWDHFSNEDANYKPHRAYDMMLPILTLPKNAAYVISTPVQYVIGAQRSYMENPESEYEQSIFKRRVKSYADRMSTYYNTAYKILGDAKLFNDIHTFHLDKRYAYDENGVLVYQQVGTEEPFHKNFNEVTNRWQTSDGNAAVAWGDRIDWSAEGLMDGYIDKDLAKELNKDIQEYTYHTFTHETAHNIDARLFLKNNGRRFDAGGEDYADSNLMQSFGPNDIVMNLSVHFDADEKIGSSLDPSRIDTPEKIQDFYEKVFETIYVIDYIEAQAFLQLNSSDKAEIGIKVSYPNEEKYKDDGNIYRARQTTGYSQIPSSEWDKMQLDTVYDLIDNRIMKYAGVYLYASRGSNSYGGEGINTAHWYQPYNPYGRPDSYALKWIAYEMLGYKGYQDGYVEYYSNIHSVKEKIYNELEDPSKGYTEVNYKTDNMAIKTISNGKYENFDEYKKARFAQTEDNLPYLKGIDVNKYVQELYDALVKDAESTRVDLAAKMEREPNCLQNYWCRVDVTNRRSYPNSTKVRQDIYYTLKNLTHDFEDEIFADEVQQEINFKVNK